MLTPSRLCAGGARGFARELGYTLVFNALIALFLWSVGFDQGFASTFTFSQSIGLSIFAAIHVALGFGGSGGRLAWARVAAAVAAGSVVGVAVGALLTGSAGLTPQSWGLLWRAVLFGLLFGALIVHFFRSRRRVAETQEALREAQIQNLVAEKRLVEARLQRLQAQVEPHFLFNTLSTVRSLIDADPAGARAMLEALTGYLRGALARTRESAGTLGQEVDVVRAFLEIFRIRLGERLRYTVRVPDELLGVTFPPLLLQPLVENAVLHGIEPSVTGGDIRVAAEANGEGVRVTVEDTGAGFGGEAGGGTGLANVRERLAALYGGRGRLVLEENRPSGVRAVLEVPLG